MDKSTERSLLSTVAKRLVFSGLFGFVFTLIALLAAALLLAAGAIPESAIPTLAVFICAVGSLVAGLRAAGGQQGYALWIGALGGLVYFALVYVAGMLFYTRLTPSQNSLPIFLASLAGGIAGGFLSNMIKHKKLR